MTVISKESDLFDPFISVFF